MSDKLEIALALYASGKSLRECEKLTKVPRSTLNREIKKTGTLKGAVSEIIAAKVQIDTTIMGLPEPMQKVVSDAVSQKMSAIEFYQSNARKVIRLGLKAFNQDPSEMGMKIVLDGMKTGMQVEGVVPFYPGPLVNNTNAQQTIHEKPKSLSDFYGDSQP